MTRRLAVLVVVVLGFAVPPADAADDYDYGGGVGTWSTSPTPARNRTPDGCVRQDFAARLDIPALVVHGPDYDYAGPMLLTGVGGGWPCTWGNSAGWFEVRSAGGACRFTGSWFDFPLTTHTHTLTLSLLGTCGRKQLELVGILTTTDPRRAAGFFVVSNCH